MKTAFESAGDLRSLDLLAAFVALWREKGGGSARFSATGASAGFDLAGGELVGVFSSDPRFESAAILLRAGKLDSAALERLTAPRGGDLSLAALQAGILTRREWRWGQKIRAIDVLADLLAWPDGKYLFDAEARPAAGDFTLPLARLLLELFLRSRDRHLIDHQLGGEDGSLVRAESFEHEFAAFGLTADAESVVRLIDGRASAAEICRQAPADEFAVRKLLAALTTLGLIRPAVPEPDQTPRPTAPESRLGTQVSVEPAHPDKPPDAPRFEGAPQEPARPISEPPLADDFADSLADEPLEEPGLDVLAAAAGADVSEEILECETPLRTEPALPPAAPRRRVLPFVLLAVVLATALAAIVLVRSRRDQVPGAIVDRSFRPISDRATRNASSPRTTAPPAALPPLSPSPGTTPAPTHAVTRVATVRSIPTALPVPLSTRADPARTAWLDRAERDRRRLQGEVKTRYAIQLELVCEVPSLQEAWKHDRPEGSMWLALAPRGNRACFRVLWGRYPSLEAARKAKAGIPPFFVTRTNRPAVVSVR